MKGEGLFMMTDLGKLLRDARSASSIAALAVRLGVSERTLSNYELGKSLPDSAFLAKFAIETGTPFTDLMQESLKAAGIDGIQVEEVFAKAGLPKSDSDEVRVPRLDLSAAAAPGGLAEGARDAERVGIPRDVLRRMAGGDPGRLRLVTADDDAMEPTICNGDLVLVDPTVTKVGASGIYVLVVDEEVLIRRAEPWFEGGFETTNDSGRYIKYHYDPKQHSGVRVAGRVRAVWRSL